MPCPVKSSGPDRRLEAFPRVSGYPYNGVVSPSYLGSGRRSVALLCFVEIRWSVDLNGGPISNT